MSPQILRLYLGRLGPFGHTLVYHAKDILEGFGGDLALLAQETMGLDLRRTRLQVAFYDD